MKTTCIWFALIVFLMALMCACSSIVDVARQGDINELKKRVNKGENINQSDDHVTAIEAAVEQGNFDIAKYLIDNGAQINLDTMYIAIKRGHYEIVRLLIEKGVSINDMKYACINTKPGINEKQKVGWGPITWAIRYKRPNILRLLIELGGNCQEKFVIKDSWPCVRSPEIHTMVVKGSIPVPEEWSTPLELAKKIATENPNSTAAAENYQTIRDCCSNSGGCTAFADLGTCGAYVAPSVWKVFDCYNLAAIGKTTNDDPFTPSWRLIGGYWQWGRKGPDPSQWYDTNTEHFAHGPTGPGSGNANSGKISRWDSSDAPNKAWSDARKTANDPCPSGSRVPTQKQWDGVLENNTQRTVGAWIGSDTNYNIAKFFGDKLMLPAAGYRRTSGMLDYRGLIGTYWSSSEDSSDRAWAMTFGPGDVFTDGALRRGGVPIRCVLE